MLLFLAENFILLKGKAGSHIWRKWSSKQFDKARLRKEEIPMIRGGGFDMRIGSHPDIRKKSGQFLQ